MSYGNGIGNYEAQHEFGAQRETRKEGKLRVGGQLAFEEKLQKAVADKIKDHSAKAAHHVVGGGELQNWLRLSEQIFRVAKWRPLPGLGCQAEWQRGEVGLIGCRAVKARMRTSAIIKIEISADRRAGFADAVVGSQIDLLIFDAAP
jgi:hypothetical protein